MENKTRKLITIDVNTRSGIKKFNIFKNTVYPFKILKGQSYPLYSIIDQPEIIFDIGANIGAASFYFAENYSKARVFAFEPSSDINIILKNNLKYFNNITVIQKALSNKNNPKVKLYLDTHNYDGSSLFKKYSTTNHLNINKYEFVKMLSCKFFCQKNNIKKIDIIKIDAEGSEVNIIYSIENYLINNSIIYLESHSKNNFEKIKKLLIETHRCIKHLDKKNSQSESIFINKKYKINN